MYQKSHLTTDIFKFFKIQNYIRLGVEREKKSYELEITSDKVLKERKKVMSYDNFFLCFTQQSDQFQRKKKF